MGDLFAEGVTDAMRDRVWAVMACAPWHTFIVLSKRAAAMRAYVRALYDRDHGEGEATARWLSTWVDHPAGRRQLIDLLSAAGSYLTTPLPNVWLGVTAEDQPRARERIPELLQTPAAKRIVSVEPMIGPVDLDPLWLRVSPSAAFLGGLVTANMPSWTRIGSTALDWVIVGGESGRAPGIRPMHPDWARQVRDDCAAAGVPFFFKQWGEWAPAEVAHVAAEQGAVMGEFHDGADFIVGCGCSEGDRGGSMRRIGKRAAGHVLDGVVHHAWPEAHA